MQLMGPRSQERESPADNCHCRDPIKKSLPTPPPHSSAGNYERTLAFTSSHYRPHNGIIKTAFLPPWVEQFSQQRDAEWFPTWSPRTPFSITVPESSGTAMLMGYPRQQMATLVAGNLSLLETGEGKWQRAASGIAAVLHWRQLWHKPVNIHNNSLASSVCQNKSYLKKKEEIVYQVRDGWWGRVNSGSHCSHQDVCLGSTFISVAHRKLAPFSICQTPLKCSLQVQNTHESESASLCSPVKPAHGIQISARAAGSRWLSRACEQSPLLASSSVIIKKE